MKTSFIVDKTKKFVYIFPIVWLFTTQPNIDSQNIKNDKIVYAPKSFVTFSDAEETYYEDGFLIDTLAIKNSTSYTEEAKKYLNLHKDQQEEVSLIAIKLREYFKEEKLLVELIDDEILINVLTPMSVLNSMNVLKRFDREWWADRFVSSKNFINVDVINL